MKVQKMMRYKSIKTYQRLKEIQPAEPVIELGTEQEIKQKLKKFREEYQGSVFNDDGRFARSQQQKQEKLQQSQTAAYSHQQQHTKQVSFNKSTPLGRNQSLQNFDNIGGNQQRKATPSINSAKNRQSLANIPQANNGGSNAGASTNIGAPTMANIPSTVEFGENFSGFIDNKFKVQLQRNMNQENPVVKMFGNALIATVFQSLVIKTIESLFKVSINVETNVPISSNVLKAFDISTIVLSSFKSPAQKSEYIMSCMDKTIAAGISSFKEKQEFKERRLEELDRESKKKASQQAKDDHFPWLKVKTEYESLRKKLNTSIIEKLNDYENLVLVLEKLKEKQDLKKLGKDTQASNVKYVLKNMNTTSTKEIFLNMSRYGNPRTQQFLSRLGLSESNQKMHPPQPQSAAAGSAGDSHSGVNSAAGAGTSHHLQGSQSATTIGSTGTGGSMSSSGSGISGGGGVYGSLGRVENPWTKENELMFKKNQKEKKQLYNNEITSSSWNEVGFLPFVQQYIFEMKKSMQREHLLDRYMGGEWLTADELKMLANTSELLNSCIDRKFMQSAVDIIDKDVIQNLELGLAEDILSNYEDIQIQIKKNRQEFINQSLQKSYSRLREYDARKKKEQRTEDNRDYLDKKEKIFTSICFKQQKEDRFREAPPKNLQGAESLHKFMVGTIGQDELLKDIKSINYYADDLNSELARKTKREEQKKQEKKNWNKYIDSISEPKETLSSKFYQSVARHNYHPPSKLFVVESERAAAEYTAEELEKYSEVDTAMNEMNKRDEEKFKLGLKSHIAYKNPSTFKSFYTGGPPKSIRTEPFYDIMSNKESKVTAKELRCIIMIQKNVRKRQQEKKLREKLETKEKDKYFEYKGKIDQIRMLAKQNIRVYPGESGKVSDIIISTTDDVPHASQAKRQLKSFTNGSVAVSSNSLNNNNNNATGSVLMSAGGLSQDFGGLTPSHSQVLSQSVQMQSQMKQKRKPMSATKREVPITKKMKVFEKKRIEEEKMKQSDVFNVSSCSEYQRPRTASTRPYSANTTAGGGGANGKSLNLSKSAQFFMHSAHYTSLMSYSILGGRKDADELDESYSDTEDSSKKEFDWDFKEKKEELVTQPIEKQLRNVKLIEAAKSNQFWAINTGLYIYSQRDLFYARDRQGQSALHWAVFHKNLEFIQWLLEHGADPNTPDCEGNTPIHVAFKTNKFEVIMIMINGGGDLNNINVKGETPLAFCSKEQLKGLNLSRGTIRIDSNNAENVKDNNSELKRGKNNFMTQGDIEKYKQQQYSMRFLSPKERESILEPTATTSKLSKSKFGNQSTG